jgi:hypothetical protein
MNKLRQNLGYYAFWLIVILLMICSWSIIPWGSGE